MIWLAVGILCFAVFAFLLAPLMRVGAAPAGARQGAVALALAAPAAAVGLYLALGSPNPEPDRVDMAQAIDRLAARVEAEPDNLAAWIMLAESFAAEGLFADAAGAFARAAVLAPEEAYLHAALGEALTMAAGGAVGREARAALDRAIALDPDQSRAQFYLALAAYQSGEKRKAYNMLRALAESAPEDAPWRETVDRQIAALEAELENEDAAAR